eukprot:CCRYP_009654-RB/>CCRYP_009654-RB protein AED:0.62 eAED:0.31 QI:0/-1/0/1/-1/0/1/0/134
MDMRFHWLRCCINQKRFRPYWRAGATNLADYVTKHHPAIHHQAVWPLFLTADQPPLPHVKLTAPCIPCNKLLRPPISRPAAIVPHNPTQIRSTSYRCKGVLCIQYLRTHTTDTYFTCVPHYLHSGTDLELYRST